MHEGTGRLLRASCPRCRCRAPDGEYNYTDYVDGCGDKYPDPLPIKVKVTIKGDNLTIDFTGTADQIKAPINVPYPCTKAAVFFAVKA